MQQEHASQPRAGTAGRRVSHFACLRVRGASRQPDSDSTVFLRYNAFLGCFSSELCLGADHKNLSLVFFFPYDSQGGLSCLGRCLTLLLALWSHCCGLYISTRGQAPRAQAVLFCPTMCPLPCKLHDGQLPFLGSHTEATQHKLQTQLLPSLQHCPKSELMLTKFKVPSPKQKFASIFAV